MFELPATMSAVLEAERFIRVATGCSAVSVVAMHALRSSAKAACVFPAGGDTRRVGPIVVQDATSSPWAMITER
jgi:hypothetical protein